MKKQSETLKCVTAIALLFTFLFSVYQYNVAEWTTATLWMAATIFGTSSIFMSSLRMMRIALIGYCMSILAAWIVHVVLLFRSNSHLNASYPGQSEATSDINHSDMRRLIIITDEFGIAFGFVASAFIVPSIVLLIDEKKKTIGKSSDQKVYNIQDEEFAC